MSSQPGITERAREIDECQKQLALILARVSLSLHPVNTGIYKVAWTDIDPPSSWYDLPACLVFECQLLNPEKRFVVPFPSDRRQQVGLYRDVCSLHLAVFCRELGQQMCDCRGERPGFPVPKCTCGLCGRKATLNSNWTVLTVLRWIIASSGAQMLTKSG